MVLSAALSEYVHRLPASDLESEMIESNAASMIFLGCVLLSNLHESEVGVISIAECKAIVPASSFFVSNLGENVCPERVGFIDV